VESSVELEHGACEHRRMAHDASARAGCDYEAPNR